MTRVSKTVTNVPHMRVGLGGNVYVICSSKLKLVAMCEELDISSCLVYDSQHHDCFVIRVRKAAYKTKVKEYFNELH